MSEEKSGAAASFRAAVPDCASLHPGYTSASHNDVGAALYFPIHFGGRFSENAFGPSM